MKFLRRLFLRKVLVLRVDSDEVGYFHKFSTQVVRIADVSTSNVVAIVEAKSGIVMTIKAEDIVFI